jgi:hypothetical protein
MKKLVKSIFIASLLLGAPIVNIDAAADDDNLKAEGGSISLDNNIFSDYGPEFDGYVFPVTQGEGNTSIAPTVPSGSSTTGYCNANYTKSSGGIFQYRTGRVLFRLCRQCLRHKV